MASDANTTPRPDRLADLVEANIVAVHAYQAILAGKLTRACPSYRLANRANPEALVLHQQALLNTDVQALKAWLAGKPSEFDRAADLESLLSASCPWMTRCR